MTLPNFDNFRPLFPMVYLILAGGIAVAGHKTGLPPEVTGMLVGAALTRVKMPTPPPKAELPKPEG
jgi:hypothetical protein